MGEKFKNAKLLKNSTLNEFLNSAKLHQLHHYGKHTRIITHCRLTFFTRDFCRICGDDMKLCTNVSWIGVSPVWQKSSILLWIMMILLFPGIGQGTAAAAVSLLLASKFHYCIRHSPPQPARSSVVVSSSSLSTRTTTSFSFITTLQLTRTSTISSSAVYQEKKRHSSLSLSHADIVWKLKPPKTPSQEQSKKEWKLGEFKISKPPAAISDDDDDDDAFRLWLSTVRAAVAVVSAGQSQVVLEAWIKEEDNEQQPQQHGGEEEEGENENNNKNNGQRRRLTKAGRFGITVQAGPPHPLIQSTIQDLFFGNNSKNYDNDNNNGCSEIISSCRSRTTAAIIYMFVEPVYRGCNLGVLALQVIAFLHGSVADCDYTMLVADDKSGSASAASAGGHEHRLVAWYEREGGFVRAPALQELMGSPNQIHGFSMIGPTTKRSATKRSQAPAAAYPPEDCTIEWYYDPDIISS